MIGTIRLAYNLVFPLALILLLPGFMARMIRRGKYRHKFAQRFAIYSDGVLEKIQDTGRIWIHAVSVGEVNIALKLIQALRDNDPSLTFVLSTTTSTGFKLAATRKTTWLEPIYNPLDFLPISRRAVNIIRPRALLLVEAEVWPNLVCEIHRLGAKAALVNARLSPKSENRFRAIRWLAAPIFNQLDLLCLQEPEDVSRWSSLGVDPSKLLVTGSVKFDDSAAAPRPLRDFRPVLDSLGIARSAPILLGGSTFEGEEEFLASTLITLRQSHPDLFLILVPRHQERADAVERRLAALGLRVARRTRLQPESSPDLLLVDNTGELASWYSCATIVFIGKSLCSRGGQNPVEAVNAGVPVLFGPHMRNFSTLAGAFLRDHAAIEVTDAISLLTAVESLLASPETCRDMARRASRCLTSHSGATARTVNALKPILLLDGDHRNPDKCAP
jgi:3-deoxy-D-manno-octulosonic-acid transferase